MTSDAKVGLLLGLVFIFVIVFIINGLPGFRGQTNNNELTTDMTDFRDNPQGLAARQRKVTREVINARPLIVPSEKKAKVKEVSESAETEDVRFETTLAKITSAAHKTVTKTEVQSAETKIAEKPKPVVKKVKPKFYVVREGDSLSSIAQKFYGPKEGNRTVNVMKIFTANRRFIKSADQIRQGQKLIIPPLNAQMDKKKNVFSNSMLEKVQSIGKRHIETSSPAAKKGRYYIVKDGDSLWKIAEQQLGNSNRYTEIVKMNSASLKDEDCIFVGMKLRLPARL